jgi:hypothetical protein
VAHAIRDFLRSFGATMLQLTAYVATLAAVGLLVVQAASFAIDHGEWLDEAQAPPLRGGHAAFKAR